jgi:hypothetical protein
LANSNLNIYYLCTFCYLLSKWFFFSWNIFCSCLGILSYLITVVNLMLFMSRKNTKKEQLDKVCLSWGHYYLLAYPSFGCACWDYCKLLNTYSLFFILYSLFRGHVLSRRVTDQHIFDILYEHITYITDYTM